MSRPEFVYCNPKLLRMNIQFLRKRKKMSRYDFARCIDMSPNFLFCVEYGMLDAIEPKPLENLSRIFGIPKEEIVTENLEKKYGDKRFYYNR
jgi:transcriptional regulator with XRE-family HTH domain